MHTLPPFLWIQEAACAPILGDLSASSRLPLVTMVTCLPADQQSPRPVDTKGATVPVSSRDPEHAACSMEHSKAAVA